MKLLRVGGLISVMSTMKTTQCNRPILPVILAAVTLFSGFGCATRRSAPIALFHGTDLHAWRQPAGEWMTARSAVPAESDPKKLTIEDGTGILVNGRPGRTANLVSVAEHSDVEAHIEFMVPKNSNSGVYFQGRYEVQILDSWGVGHPKYGDCGGIYASCSDPKPDSPGSPPSVNASRPPGEWQSFDVLFRAPRFDAAGRKTENARFVRVVHNGQVIHENVESPRPTCSAAWLDEKPLGPLMLQGDHGPVAYRNISIRPTSLP
jgi:hypothetical protein